MSITVVYKDFEDMVSQAKIIASMAGGFEGGQIAEQSTPIEAPAPSAPTVPSMPAPAVSATAAPTAVPTTAPTTPAASVVPSAAVPTPPAAGAVPTSAPTYTADDLARAAVTLMDAGRMADLQQLLGQFGVASLPELKQEQYGMFATALRGMGAPI